MRLLVTGATGFIGSRFCTLAIRAGYEVTALVRPGRGGNLPAAVERVHGALPYDVPERAWRGVHMVVHCAAVTTAGAAGQSYAVNLEGTRFLLEAAKRHGVSRFIFLTSQSAHEAAVSDYGITKLQGEKLVRDSGLVYSILRPGLVIGPGRQGLFYRMRQSVQKLPLLPLLGGGKALVQAIHVDDLCEAILKCISLPQDLKIELNLGDPKGVTLGEFLQRVAQAERGKRKFQVVIPTAPIKAVVGVGEKLRIPMPISSDNLRGMELVRKMETAHSLERIGLELRTLDDAIADSVRDEVESDAEGFGAGELRVLLVGAGKIGIVHALNLRQREGVRFAGIVDHNPKAFGMYRTMGFAVPFFSTLEEAVASEKPDGVIVATPASTHLEIARWCMERGIPVLVEKPLSIKLADVIAFEELARAYPTVPCHTGYMAAQFPHLVRARELLSSGTLGQVVRVEATALQSHIMAASPVRWEMVLAQSGGGALINFASHVLSLIFRLFGMPVSTEGARWPVYSTEVEDAFAARLKYDGFHVSFAGSWSAPGYPRPMNRIEITCERGRVILDNFGVSVQSAGNTQGLWSQRSFDAGYNASPDYTGGGFAVEHENFLEAIAEARGNRTRRPGADGIPKPVTLDEAAILEEWIHQFYQAITLGEANDEKVATLLMGHAYAQELQALRVGMGSL